MWCSTTTTVAITSTGSTTEGTRPAQRIEGAPRIKAICTFISACASASASTIGLGLDLGLSCIWLVVAAVLPLPLSRWRLPRLWLRIGPRLRPLLLWSQL